MSAIWVITVNWNNARQTAALLRSLRSAHPPPSAVRIAVVDNASSDGSAAQIAERFPQALILHSSRNGGYAAAANLGLQHALEAGADYLWLLNNDTIVDAKTLPALLQAAQTIGRPAILSPLIYYLDRPEVIWFAGGRLDRRLKTEHIGQGERDRGQFAGLHPVAWVSGCAPFFSRPVVERAGLWPTDYFLYLEDVDWCLGAQAAGVGCYLAGDAPLWHDVSSTVSTLDPALLRYYAWRNYYLLGRRRGRGLARLRIEADLWSRLAKAGLRWLLFPAYRRDEYYHARTHGLLDLLRGQTGIGAWPARAFADAAQSEALRVAA